MLYFAHFVNCDRFSMPFIQINLHNELNTAHTAQSSMLMYFNLSYLLAFPFFFHVQFIIQASVNFILK